jgi:hypothetical protein
MTTVTFATVWAGILGLLEKPVGTVLDATYEALLVGWVNQRAREGWNHGLWPELLVMEARAFRPIWSALVTYAGGDERYLAVTDKYYVALQASLNKDPATETTYWREMTGAELDPYLPWLPADLAPLGTVKWVGQNDRVRYADRPYSFDHVVSSRGLEVIGSGIGTKVWVQHRPPPNRYSRTVLGDGEQPTLGQVVLSTHGECYQATRQNGADTWTWMYFPAFLQGFVEQGVLANDLRRDGQKERADYAEQEAARLIEKEWDVQVGQQGQ